MRKKGTVWGAVYDEFLHIKHARAETSDERDRMRGSKYAQSNTLFVFESIRKDLLSERDTFFSGTPCQVAALLSYLCKTNTPMDKLMTMDFICHGVMGGNTHAQFFEFVRNNRHKTIKSFTQRSKHNGWYPGNNDMDCITFTDGSVDDSSVIVHIPTIMYQCELGLRDMCYHCPYATVHRISDITVSDFWSVSNAIPSFYDVLGVSMIMVNTQKGNTILRAASNTMDMREILLDDALNNHFSPIKVKQDRIRTFWETYGSRGYAGLATTYGQYNFMGRIKSLAYSMHLDFLPLKKLYATVNRMITK